MVKVLRNHVLLCVCFLSGCADTLDRLEGIGKAPPLAKVNRDPIARRRISNLSPGRCRKRAGSRQDDRPTPLWQPGARTFFRDGRAARVGDLLRVKINITDQAEFDNNTTSTRTTQETVAAPSLFGLEQGRLQGDRRSARQRSGERA